MEVNDFNQVESGPIRERKGEIGCSSTQHQQFGAVPCVVFHWQGGWDNGSRHLAKIFFAKQNFAHEIQLIVKHVWEVNTLCLATALSLKSTPLVLVRFTKASHN
ncbi:SH3 domain-containing RING finger protein 3 [Platysternon megacephalum]|uniref:SH3 domain-containing RING finger protein 3 n=1 Tax=Platysternon megacephalum TaxID=55544 RepID=A0A4D9EEV5_9SAUR|nr:SH3 domain-containing RING finger protein 3 [Platysternon megacephalum]